MKQRGSGWSIKLVFNLYKLFGYKFIYYLMYPVTFFYFIFANNVKEALKIYYKRVNHPFNNYVYFEHLRVFAICMVDRFISKQDPKSYTFLYEDEKRLRELLNRRNMLIFSHFGGWASTANKPITNKKINIVMKESMLKSIKDIEDSIEKKVSNVNIIDLSQGQIHVSIEIANAISNNELISMMADRPTSLKYSYRVKFLGCDAFFNENPFKIAYKTKTPILAYFTILKAPRTYEIKVINLDFDYELEEKESIKNCIEEYVSILEDILKDNPKQWFNFYNFWEKNEINN